MAKGYSKDLRVRAVELVATISASFGVSSPAKAVDPVATGLAQGTAFPQLKRWGLLDAPLSRGIDSLRFNYCCGYL